VAEDSYWILTWEFQSLLSFGKKIVAENFFLVYNKGKERRMDKRKSFSVK